MGSFNGRQLIRTASLKLAVLFGSVLFAALANATPLLDLTSSIAAADPTQLGRISRNGVPSDWSTSKAFPGVINPGVSYHYHTYTLNTQAASFVQIIMDSTFANTFASVYLGAYLPGSGLATNYLGDAGQSGNFFGAVDTGTFIVTDPLFFQVQVVPYSNLVLVVNESSGIDAGLLQPFRFIVEGFLDREFTDIPVPTPGTVSLFGVALLGFAFARKKMGVRA